MHFQDHLLSGSRRRSCNFGGHRHHRFGKAALSCGRFWSQSEAYRRGLRSGVELVEFAGRQIRSVNQFKNVLGIYPSGWKLPLTYRRDGEQKSIVVRLRTLAPGRGTESRGGGKLRWSCRFPSCQSRFPVSKAASPHIHSTISMRRSRARQFPLQPAGDRSVNRIDAPLGTVRSCTRGLDARPERPARHADSGEADRRCRRLPKSARRPTFRICSEPCSTSRPELGEC